MAQLLALTNYWLFRLLALIVFHFVYKISVHFMHIIYTVVVYFPQEVPNFLGEEPGWIIGFHWLFFKLWSVEKSILGVNIFVMIYFEETNRKMTELLFPVYWKFETSKCAYSILLIKLYPIWLFVTSWNYGEGFL